MSPENHIFSSKLGVIAAVEIAAGDWFDGQMSIPVVPSLDCGRPGSLAERESLSLVDCRVRPHAERALDL